MSDLLGNDLTYNLFKKALDASYLRNQTISNNIANVNTKNFKASKVVFEEELKKAMGESSVSLKATSRKHFGIRKNNLNINPKVVKNESLSMRNDGNNVDIDLEMANLGANQLLYNTLVQQANKKISTLRYVIHEGRR